MSFSFEEYNVIRQLGNLKFDGFLRPIAYEVLCGSRWLMAISLLDSYIVMTHMVGSVSHGILPIALYTRQATISRSR
jgi:hypothetical protein